VAALAWISVPILDRTMSLGEPFGSMFAVVPALFLAGLATLLGLGCGIASLVWPRSRLRKRTGLAVVGILLSLGGPLVLWAVVVFWG
jgi:hypothetical protein